MVLVHTIFDFFTLIPYIVVSIIALNTTITNDPIVGAYIHIICIS